MRQKEFSNIVQLIKVSRAKAVNAINAELVNLYWNIGAYISQQLSNTNWGEKTVEELAIFIKKNHPELKGFNRRGLYRMKQFYETYISTSYIGETTKIPQTTDNQTNEIVSSLMTQFKFRNIHETILAKISWTHHLTLISRTKTDEEREFYLRLCIKDKYSVRELERQINSSIFERVVIGNAKLPDTLKAVHPNIDNNLKDSYIFEFLNLPKPHNERDIQKGLVAQMKNFILELGKDYLFIDQEYKIQVGNSDFYIDLLFYHRGLQCLIAFELKADKFKPEHLGQLNFYLEALDRDVKKENENPSIGILLCKDKNNEIVEYALSRTLSPTMVAEYNTLLPDKKLLKQKLNKIFQNSEDRQS